MILYKKGARKMLVKLTTPWVNFINILQAAFAQADLKSAKKFGNLSVFFGLFGSAAEKLHVEH